MGGPAARGAILGAPPPARPAQRGAARRGSAQPSPARLALPGDREGGLARAPGWLRKPLRKPAPGRPADNAAAPRPPHPGPPVPRPRPPATRPRRTCDAATSLPATPRGSQQDCPDPEDLSGHRAQPLPRAAGTEWGGVGGRGGRHAPAGAEGEGVDGGTEGRTDRERPRSEPCSGWREPGNGGKSLWEMGGRSARSRLLEPDGLPAPPLGAPGPAPPAHTCPGSPPTAPAPRPRRPWVCPRTRGRRGAGGQVARAGPQGAEGTEGDARTPPAGGREDGSVLTWQGGRGRPVQPGRRAPLSAGPEASGPSPEGGAARGAPHREAQCGCSPRGEPQPRCGVRAPRLWALTGVPSACTDTGVHGLAHRSTRTQVWGAGPSVSSEVALAALSAGRLRPGFWLAGAPAP